MTEVVQILSRGLGIGSVYALLALGFVIIYKSTRVISFAQPSFMLAGAVLVTYLAGPFGFFIGLALAALATGVLAFTVAIITLGVDVIIRTVAQNFIGIELRQTGDPWGLKPTTLFGIEVQQRHLAMIVVAAVVVGGLLAFFRYTRMGLAMRAAAFDQEAAMAQGVSVGGVFALSWGIAGALAAVGGAFAAVGGSVESTLWVTALVALPVIIVGGLDSLLGAVVGGLLVGVTQEVIAQYQRFFPEWLGGNASVISAYVLMLLILLVRPYGLFGTREVERV